MPKWVVIYRAGFGLLGFIALAVAFIVSQESPNFDLIDFFSYFTVLSNIMAAGMLLFLAITKKSTRTLDAWRGAVVVYMSITGVVYGLILTEAAGQSLLPWVNTVLHRVMPVVVLVDWILVPPASKLSKKLIWEWLVFPLIFVAYTLLRGPEVHWYPYFFLNPVIEHGYLNVAKYIAVILTGSAIVSWLVMLVGNRKNR